MDILNEENIAWQKEEPLFEAKDIDISSYNYNIYSLLSRFEQKEIIWNNELQLKNFKWDENKESLFIESILLGLPLPVFYIKETMDGTWFIVDGFRRLSAIKRFVIDKELTLTKKNGGLEILTNLDGKKYDDLDLKLQRKMEESQISIFMIGAGTPNIVSLFLFKRLNIPQNKRTSEEMQLRFGTGY